MSCVIRNARKSARIVSIRVPFGEGRVCDGGYEVSQDDALLRSFRERVPLPGRVLELGCMEGGRTFPLARRCGQVLAIDVRREALDLSQAFAERFTHAALAAHGVGIEREGFRYAGGTKRKIDCNAVYRLMDHGLWWPLLKGKRLAIVSGHADEFAARLVDPEFVKATGGGEVTWSVATKITCPGTTVAKRKFWNRVREELFATEWDLLLCSAGSLSAVICEAARQMGQTSLDVGSLDCDVRHPLVV